MMAMVNHSIRDRLAELRATIATAARRAKKTAADANVALERAMAAMGVAPPQDEGDVVDVGDDPVSGGVVSSLARRTAKGLMLLTAASLLACALWALGMFAAASILAFLVLTRGLGLRIDLNAARPA
jgi:hypothetical protein